MAENHRGFRGGTLVLGAGELGMAVLRALSERRGVLRSPALTVLLRPIGDATSNRDVEEQAESLNALGVTIVRADLASNDQAALAAMFAPFSTVICCTGFVGGPGTQRKITGAVLQAGVARYVPWQFGVDYDKVGYGSGQDVWDEQLDVRAMLRAQSRTRWVIVSSGMFTSFLFEPSFGVVDLSNDQVHALGSWDNEVTVTTSADIGRLTTAILSIQPELEGVVFVAGDTVSYAELAATLEQVLDRPIKRVLWSVQQLQSDLATNPGDDIKKYRLAFARGTGVAWAKDRTFNAEHGIPVDDLRTWLRAQPRA